MQPVPENKMRKAKEDDRSRGFLACQPSVNAEPAHAFERDHTHQNKQTRQRRDVMRIKIWIKVRCETEQKDGQKHPDESELAQAEQICRKHEVQRSEKEESIKTNPAAETLDVGLDRVGVFSVNFGLGFVVELLFAGQLPMRNHIRLCSKRRRDAVLILAERIGQGRPTA